MNEEVKTTPITEPAAEKQTKPVKPKRTDEEKLQECYEKRDRLWTIVNKVDKQNDKIYRKFISA